MSENENTEKIINCKWRSPKVAWVPILYTMLLGIASVIIFSSGTVFPEIGGMRIALSLTLGIMTVSMTYLILKKGQSNIAIAITLLSSLASIIVFIPDVSFPDAIGLIIVVTCIGIPINYYWDHACKKTSG